jgi:hypothetical protein
MQSTLVKHNKFFKAGHATSFDTAKKYAVSCDAASSEYARVPDPGLITTGDFSFTMSFRYNNGIGSTGPFRITDGFNCRIHWSAGTLRTSFGDGINSTGFDSNNNLGDGEWHTIVMTFDRDGDMVYYEDLKADLTFEDTITTDISSVTGSLEDAGSDDDWYFGFDGTARYSGIDIDQIAVFDSSLSAFYALTAAYRLLSGKGIDSIGGETPICYWKCNEGTGNTVANDGSEDDVLQLYNTPTWITDGVI